MERIHVVAFGDPSKVREEIDRIKEVVSKAGEKAEEAERLCSKLVEVVRSVEDRDARFALAGTIVEEFLANTGLTVSDLIAILEITKLDIYLSSLAASQQIGGIVDQELQMERQLK